MAASSAKSATAAPLLIDATIQAGVSFVNGNCAACSAHAARLAQSEVLAMSSSMTPFSLTILTLVALGGALALAGGDSPVHGRGSAPAAAVLQLATTEGNSEINQFEDSNEVLVQLTSAEETAVPPTAANAIAQEEPGVEGISRNEERIVTALQSRVRAPIEFVETPLREVATYLAEEYGFPVIIDVAAFDAVAASPDMPVTFSIQNVSLRSALKLMLKNVGGEDLTYVVDNEVLVLTTAEEASAHLEPVVYDLGEITSLLGTNVEEISKILSEAVARDTWQVSGSGEGTMQPMGNRYLVISQSQSVHEEIAKLLVQMEQKGEAAK
jgi:hypothetical protein